MKTIFVPKIFYLSGNFTQVFGGNVVAMAYRLDGVQCNVKLSNDFSVDTSSELYEIGDILLTKTLEEAYKAGLPIDKGGQFNFLGNMHGVKETMVYCEAVILAQLAQLNHWDIDEVQLAQMGAMILMDIDPQLFVLFELIILFTLLAHTGDMVYLNCLTLEARCIELIDDRQLTIQQIPHDDMFNVDAISTYINDGLSALSNLSIFLSIHALAQVGNTDLHEYQSYLSNQEIKACRYVIDESLLSRNIGATKKLNSNVLINYLSKKKKIPFYCFSDKLDETIKSCDLLIVNRKYMYCLTWKPQAV